MLKIKRIYKKKSSSDGLRVYVDRLWPRGMKKEDAAIDEWLKELAPGDELRKWFGHDPEKFPEFRKRYISELADPARKKLLQYISDLAEKRDVTILFSASDTVHNNAVVLFELIGKMSKAKASA